MPRRGNRPGGANLTERQTNRRQVMRESRRLQYATELYLEMIELGNFQSWLDRQLARRRYTHFARYIFERKGKLASLPLRNDKIEEKLFQAYADLVAEENAQRAAQHAKTTFVAHVPLNNGNTRRINMGIRSNNGRVMTIVAHPGNNKARSPKNNNGKRN